MEANMTRRALPFVLLLSACGIGHASAAAFEPAAMAAPFVLDAGEPGGVDLWSTSDATATPATESTCASPWIEADAAPAGPIASSVESLAGPLAQATTAQTTLTPRPMAFEYSDGYQTRLKIHKYASFATLPLFIAQFAVGQKLYNGTGSDSTKSAHTVLAIGTGTLFAVNTVTGVMNYSEGRKDPSAGKKRKVHAFLMALADAGFVATGLMTPESHEGNESGFEQEGGGTSQSTHRAVALSSMGVATVAYLMMLFH
jgi:hypothetical protein